jgi:hypothetical protein
MSGIVSILVIGGFGVLGITVNLHHTDGGPTPLVDADIARVNLSYCEGLPGTAGIDPRALVMTLDGMAARVRTETERHLYRFRRNPGDYENSEGFFRMLMLTVVLAEDFGIHYDPDRISSPGATNPSDGFFAHPEDVFLVGVLGPKRVGTCSSMPVLYVAVGRRLGYPLKLVTTKGHLFVRWEGRGERFNIEATSHGLNCFSDDYYRHWPFEITREEEAAEGYLKSLSPAEEAAVFLSIRGMCLRESGRIGEAAQAFTEAARLAPNCQGYRDIQKRLQRELSVESCPALPQARAHQSL